MEESEAHREDQPGGPPESSLRHSPVTQETVPSNFSEIAGDPSSLDVLLVDDSISILKIMTMSLQRAGHRVHQATDGQCGLDMMKAQRFDLVLMDFQMPVMGGVEAVTKFREFEEAERIARGDHQVIIGMSARGDSSTKDEALNCGMDAFVAKPFSVEAVLEQYRELTCVTSPEKSIIEGAEADD